jgi:hypothetical protein
MGHMQATSSAAPRLLGVILGLALLMLSFALVVAELEAVVPFLHLAVAGLAAVLVIRGGPPATVARSLIVTCIVGVLLFVGFFVLVVPA